MLHFASLFTSSAHQRSCAVLFRFSSHWVVIVDVQVVKSQSHESSWIRASWRYCTGPAHSENKQSELAEVDEPTNTESTPLTNENGAASSSQPLLQSLAESVRLLSTEMKALRQEINELRTFVRAFASEQPTPVVPPSMSARAARYDGFDKNSGSACGSTLWSNKRSLTNESFVVDLFRNIGIKCLRYFNSSRTMLLDQLRCDFQRI